MGGALGSLVLRLTDTTSVLCNREVERSRLTACRSRTEGQWRRQEIGNRRRPASFGNVTPVAFTIRQEADAAPGPNGRSFLLDAESLVVPIITRLCSRLKRFPRQGRCLGQPGRVAGCDGGWLGAGVSLQCSCGKVTGSNGAVKHGAIVAFRMAEQDGKMTLTPAWVSQDMVNPSALASPNGVVIALSQGDSRRMQSCWFWTPPAVSTLYEWRTISTYARLCRCVDV